MLKPSSMAKVVAASVILSASSAVLAGDAYMGASIGLADYEEKWQDLDLSDEVIAVDYCKYSSWQGDFTLFCC